MRAEYVLCIKNDGYPASLEIFKLYRTASEVPGDADRGMIRVIDESGEDYLFPSKYFISMSLKEPVRQIISSRFRSYARQKLAA